MLQGEHQGGAHDDQSKHDLTPADPRSAILSPDLQHGLHLSTCKAAVLVWKQLWLKECEISKHLLELNPEFFMSAWLVVPFAVCKVYTVCHCNDQPQAAPGP